MNKSENRYREFSARNYNEFKVEEFVKLVENKLQESQEYDINAKAKKTY